LKEGCQLRSWRSLNQPRGECRGLSLEQGRQQGGLGGGARLQGLQLEPSGLRLHPHLHAGAFREGQLALGGDDLAARKFQAYALGALFQEQHAQFLPHEPEQRLYLRRLQPRPQKEGLHDGG